MIVTMIDYTTVNNNFGCIQRKYWDLKCWTEFEFWIYEGGEFQMDEPENTNVFRYTLSTVKDAHF